jgi:hypothetical protein
LINQDEYPSDTTNLADKIPEKVKGPELLMENEHTEILKFPFNTLMVKFE